MRDVGFQQKSQQGVDVKKKKVAAKAVPKTDAPQIGGTTRGQKQATWPKVGRKRLATEADPIESLAKEIKAAREAKKISIGTMAKQLDVAPATLIKFEDRYHPISVGIVLRMAERIGYSLTLTKSSKRK